MGYEAIKAGCFYPVKSVGMSLLRREDGQPPFNGEPFHVSLFDVKSLFLKFLLAFRFCGRWMNIEHSLNAIMTREGIALFLMLVIAQA